MTKILANERGHLNPTVHRSPASPWGRFVGTWQAERKPIQLKTRTKLMTHLSKIKQTSEGGAGSKGSSRVSSAKISQESQRGSVTSPRPQSAQASQQGDSQEETRSTSSPHTTQHMNDDDDDSKSSVTPNTPPTTTGIVTPPIHGSLPKSSPAPQDPSRTTSPQSSSSRAVSAVSTRRSRVSRTPTPSIASRAQSANTVRTTSHQSPPDSAQSHVSSVALSYKKEDVHSPLPSTRVSSPCNTNAAATAAESASEATSRTGTVLSNNTQ